MKVATKPKTFGIRDTYVNYANGIIEKYPKFTFKRKYCIAKGEIFDESGNLYMDYKIFKNCIRLYYIKAGVKLINGYALELGLALGDIFILRQERNPNSKPRLNRGESFKRKKRLEAAGEEITKENWKIYYTDDEFTKTAWFRPSGTKNLNFYKFSPANGQAGKGFKQLMSRYISSHPQVLAFYPFVPYKKVA